jgi:hypothetical protein
MIYLCGGGQVSKSESDVHGDGEGYGGSLLQENVEQKLVNEGLIWDDTLRRGDSQHVLRVAPC